jgi:hypothetical protein
MKITLGGTFTVHAKTKISDENASAETKLKLAVRVDGIF